MWGREVWGGAVGLPHSGGVGLGRAAQIELLQLLVGIANENGLGVALEVKIKFNIIASLYDYNPNLATYMKVWGAPWGGMWGGGSYGAGGGQGGAD